MTPARQTLRPRHRLRRRRDIERVFAGARPSSGRYLTVRALARTDGVDEARLGLAIGKRCGNAPRRNRIKRRVREIFRRHRDRLPPGCDLVVSAHSAQAATCAMAELVEELIALAVRSARARPRSAPPESRP